MKLSNAVIKTFSNSDFHSYPGVEGENPLILEIGGTHLEFEHLANFIQLQIVSKGLIGDDLLITELTFIADDTGIYFQAFIDMGDSCGATFCDTFIHEVGLENKDLLENILKLSLHKPLITMKLVEMGLFNFVQENI